MMHLDSEGAVDFAIKIYHFFDSACRDEFPQLLRVDGLQELADFLDERPPHLQEIRRQFGATILAVDNKNINNNSNNNNNAPLSFAMLKKNEEEDKNNQLLLQRKQLLLTNTIINNIKIRNIVATTTTSSSKENPNSDDDNNKNNNTSNPPPPPPPAKTPLEALLHLHLQKQESNVDTKIDFVPLACFRPSRTNPTRQNAAADGKAFLIAAMQASNSNSVTISAAQQQHQEKMQKLLNARLVKQRSCESMARYFSPMVRTFSMHWLNRDRVLEFCLGEPALTRTQVKRLPFFPISVGKPQNPEKVPRNLYLPAPGRLRDEANSKGEWVHCDVVRPDRVDEHGIVRWSVVLPPSKQEIEKFKKSQTDFEQQQQILNQQKKDLLEQIEQLKLQLIYEQEKTNNGNGDDDDDNYHHHHGNVKSNNNNKSNQLEFSLTETETALQIRQLENLVEKVNGKIQKLHQQVQSLFPPQPIVASVPRVDLLVDTDVPDMKWKLLEHIRVHRQELSNSARYDIFLKLFYDNTPIQEEVLDKISERVSLVPSNRVTPEFRKSLVEEIGFEFREAIKKAKMDYLFMKDEMRYIFEPILGEDIVNASRWWKDINDANSITSEKSKRSLVLMSQEHEQIHQQSLRLHEQHGESEAVLLIYGYLTQRQQSYNVVRDQLSRRLRFAGVTRKCFNLVHSLWNDPRFSSRKELALFNVPAQDFKNQWHAQLSAFKSLNEKSLRSAVATLRVEYIGDTDVIMMQTIAQSFSYTFLSQNDFRVSDLHRVFCACSIQHANRISAFAEEELRRFLKFLQGRASAEKDAAADVSTHQSRTYSRILLKLVPTPGDQTPTGDIGISLSDSLTKVGDTLKQLVQNALEQLGSIPTIQTVAMHSLKLPAQTVALHVDDKLVTTVLDEIELAAMHEPHAVCESLVKDFQKIVPRLYDRRRQDEYFNAQRLKETTLLRQDIEKCRDSIRHVKLALPDLLVSGLIAIDTTDAKKAVIAQWELELERILEMIHIQISRTCTSCIDEAERISARLEKRPSTVEEMHEFADYSIAALKRITGMEKHEAKHVITWVYLLETYRVPVQEEVALQTMLLCQWPRRLEDQFIRSERLMKEEKRQILDELDDGREGILLAIDALADTVEDLFSQHELEWLAETHRRVVATRNTIDDLSKQARVLREREILFDRDTTDFPRLERLRKDFEVVEKFWGTISSALQGMRRFQELQILQVEANELRDAVEGWRADLHASIRRLRGYPKTLSTGKRVAAILCRFHETTVPLVTMLRRPGMRQKQWQELSKRLDLPAHQELNPTDNNLTLQALLESKVATNLPILQTLSEKVHQEHTVEQRLESLKVQAKNVDITFKSIPDGADAEDPDTVVFAGNLHELLPRIEQLLSGVQGVRKSQYIGTSLGQAIEWEMRLQACMDVVSLWMRVQENWATLFPVLGNRANNHHHQPKLQGSQNNKDSSTENNNSNNNNREEENAKSFMELHSILRNIVMDVRKQDQPLMYLMLHDRLPSQLRDIDSQFVSMLRQVFTMLDTKRAACPRLFFATDEQLMECLSSSSMNSIQHLIHAVFSEIAKLEEKDRSITAVISYDGCRFGLSPGVPAGSESGQTAEDIEFFLRRFERTLTHALISRTDVILKESIRSPLPTWLLKTPCGQVSTLVQRIRFTREIEEVLSVTGHRGLKSYLKKQLREQEELQSIVRARTTLRQSEIFVASGAFALFLQQRDAVESMITQNVNHVEEFRSLPIFRVYAISDRDGQNSADSPGTGSTMIDDHLPTFTASRPGTTSGTSDENNNNSKTPLSPSSPSLATGFLTKCLVQLCGIAQPYQFQFLGHTAPTIWTDAESCLAVPIFASSIARCGSPFLESSQNNVSQAQINSNTIQQVASIVGANFIPIQCTPRIDFRALLPSLLGSLTNATWLFLRDPQLLPQEVQDELAQILTGVQNALAKHRESVEWDGIEVELLSKKLVIHPGQAFFGGSTTNFSFNNNNNNNNHSNHKQDEINQNYSARAALSPLLSEHFRPCSVVATPDWDSFAGVVMASYWGIEATLGILANRLSRLFRLGSQTAPSNREVYSKSRLSMMIRWASKCEERSIPETALLIALRIFVIPLFGNDNEQKQFFLHLVKLCFGEDAARTLGDFNQGERQEVLETASDFKAFGSGGAFGSDDGTATSPSSSGVLSATSQPTQKSNAEDHAKKSTKKQGEDEEESSSSTTAKWPPSFDYEPDEYDERYLPLLHTDSFAIVGPPFSGKTSLLHSLFGPVAMENSVHVNLRCVSAAYLFGTVRVKTRTGETIWVDGLLENIARLTRDYYQNNNNSNNNSEGGSCKLILLEGVDNHPEDIVELALRNLWNSTGQYSYKRTLWTGGPQLQMGSSIGCDCEVPIPDVNNSNNNNNNQTTSMNPSSSNHSASMRMMMSGEKNPHAASNNNNNPQNSKFANKLKMASTTKNQNNSRTNIRFVCKLESLVNASPWFISEITCITAPSLPSSSASATGLAFSESAQLPLPNSGEILLSNTSFSSQQQKHLPSTSARASWNDSWKFCVGKIDPAHLPFRNGKVVCESIGAAIVDALSPFVAQSFLGVNASSSDPAAPSLRSRVFFAGFHFFPKILAMMTSDGRIIEALHAHQYRSRKNKLKMLSEANLPSDEEENEQQQQRRGSSSINSHPSALNGNIFGTATARSEGKKSNANNSNRQQHHIGTVSFASRSTASDAASSSVANKKSNSNGHNREQEQQELHAAMTAFNQVSETATIAMTCSLIFSFLWSLAPTNEPQLQKHVETIFRKQLLGHIASLAAGCIEGAATTGGSALDDFPIESLLPAINELYTSCPTPLGWRSFTSVVEGAAGNADSTSSGAVAGSGTTNPSTASAATANATTENGQDSSKTNTNNNKVNPPVSSGVQNQHHNVSRLDPRYIGNVVLDQHTQAQHQISSQLHHHHQRVSRSASSTPQQPSLVPPTSNNSNHNNNNNATQNAGFLPGNNVSSSFNPMKPFERVCTVQVLSQFVSVLVSGSACSGRTWLLQQIANSRVQFDFSPSLTTASNNNNNFVSGSPNNNYNNKSNNNNAAEFEAPTSLMLIEKLRREKMQQKNADPFGKETSSNNNNDNSNEKQQQISLVTVPTLVSCCKTGRDDAIQHAFDSQITLSVEQVKVMAPSNEDSSPNQQSENTAPQTPQQNYYYSKQVASPPPGRHLLLLIDDIHLPSTSRTAEVHNDKKIPRQNLMNNVLEWIAFHAHNRRSMSNKVGMLPLRNTTFVASIMSTLMTSVKTSSSSTVPSSSKSSFTSHSHMGLTNELLSRSVLNFPLPHMPDDFFARELLIGLCDAASATDVSHLFVQLNAISGLISVAKQLFQDLTSRLSSQLSMAASTAKLLQVSPHQHTSKFKMNLERDHDENDIHCEYDDENNNDAGREINRIFYSQKREMTTRTVRCVVEIARLAKIFHKVELEGVFAKACVSTVASEFSCAPILALFNAGSISSAPTSEGKKQNVFHTVQLLRKFQSEMRTKIGQAGYTLLNTFFSSSPNSPVVSANAVYNQHKNSFSPLNNFEPASPTAAEMLQDDYFPVPNDGFSVVCHSLISASNSNQQIHTNNNINNNNNHHGTATNINQQNVPPPLLHIPQVSVSLSGHRPSHSSTTGLALLPKPSMPECEVRSAAQARRFIRNFFGDVKNQSYHPNVVHPENSVKIEDRFPITENAATFIPMIESILRTEGAGAAVCLFGTPLHALTGFVKMLCKSCGLMPFFCDSPSQWESACLAAGRAASASEGSGSMIVVRLSHIVSGCNFFDSTDGKLASASRLMNNTSGSAMNENPFSSALPGSPLSPNKLSNNNNNNTTSSPTTLRKDPLLGAFTSASSSSAGASSSMFGGQNPNRHANSTTLEHQQGLKRILELHEFFTTGVLQSFLGNDAMANERVGGATSSSSGSGAGGQGSGSSGNINAHLSKQMVSDSTSERAQVFRRNVVWMQQRLRILLYDDLADPLNYATNCAKSTAISSVPKIFVKLQSDYPGWRHVVPFFVGHFDLEQAQRDLVPYLRLDKQCWEAIKKKTTGATGNTKGMADAGNDNNVDNKVVSVANNNNSPFTPTITSYSAIDNNKFYYTSPQHRFLACDSVDPDDVFDVLVHDILPKFQSQSQYQQHHQEQCSNHYNYSPIIFALHHSQRNQLHFTFHFIQTIVHGYYSKMKKSLRQLRLVTTTLLKKQKETEKEVHETEPMLEETILAVHDHETKEASLADLVKRKKNEFKASEQSALRIVTEAERMKKQVEFIRSEAASAYKDACDGLRRADHGQMLNLRANVAPPAKVRQLLEGVGILLHEDPAKHSRIGSNIVPDMFSVVRRVMENPNQFVQRLLAVDGDTLWNVYGDSALAGASARIRPLVDLCETSKFQTYNPFAQILADFVVAVNMRVDAVRSQVKLERELLQRQQPTEELVVVIESIRDELSDNQHALNKIREQLTTYRRRRDEQVQLIIRSRSALGRLQQINSAIVCVLDRLETRQAAVEDRLRCADGDSMLAAIEMVILAGIPCSQETKNKILQQVVEKVFQTKCNPPLPFSSNTNNNNNGNAAVFSPPSAMETLREPWFQAFASSHTNQTPAHRQPLHGHRNYHRRRIVKNGIVDGSGSSSIHSGTTDEDDDYDEESEDSEDDDDDSMDDVGSELDESRIIRKNKDLKKLFSKSVIDLSTLHKPTTIMTPLEAKGYQLPDSFTAFLLLNTPTHNATWALTRFPFFICRDDSSCSSTVSNTNSNNNNNYTSSFKNSTTSAPPPNMDNTTTTTSLSQSGSFSRFESMLVETMSRCSSDVRTLSMLDPYLLNQLTSAASAGASVILLDAFYPLPDWMNLFCEIPTLIKQSWNSLQTGDLLKLVINEKSFTVNSKFRIWFVSTSSSSNVRPFATKEAFVDAREKFTIIDVESEPGFQREMMAQRILNNRPRAEGNDVSFFSALRDLNDQECTIIGHAQRMLEITDALVYTGDASSLLGGSSSSKKSSQKSKNNKIATGSRMGDFEGEEELTLSSSEDNNNNKHDHSGSELLKSNMNANSSTAKKNKSGGEDAIIINPIALENDGIGKLLEELVNEFDAADGQCVQWRAQLANKGKDRRMQAESLTRLSFTLLAVAKATHKFLLPSEPDIGSILNAAVLENLAKSAFTRNGRLVSATTILQEGFFEHLSIETTIRVCSLSLVEAVLDKFLPSLPLHLRPVACAFVVMGALLDPVFGPVSKHQLVMEEQNNSNGGESVKPSLFPSSSVKSGSARLNYSSVMERQWFEDSLEQLFPSCTREMLTIVMKQLFSVTTQEIYSDNNIEAARGEDVVVDDNSNELTTAKNENKITITIQQQQEFAPKWLRELSLAICQNDKQSASRVLHMNSISKKCVEWIQSRDATFCSLIGSPYGGNKKPDSEDSDMATSSSNNNNNNKIPPLLSLKEDCLVPSSVQTATKLGVPLMIRVGNSFSCEGTDDGNSINNNNNNAISRAISWLKVIASNSDAELSIFSSLSSDSISTAVTRHMPHLFRSGGSATLHLPALPHEMKRKTVASSLSPPNMNASVMNNNNNNNQQKKKVPVPPISTNPTNKSGSIRSNTNVQSTSVSESSARTISDDGASTFSSQQQKQTWVVFVHQNSSSYHLNNASSIGANNYTHRRCCSELFSASMAEANIIWSKLCGYTRILAQRSKLQQLDSRTNLVSSNNNVPVAFLVLTYNPEMMLMNNNNNNNNKIPVFTSPFINNGSENRSKKSSGDHSIITYNNNNNNTNAMSGPLLELPQRLTSDMGSPPTANAGTMITARPTSDVSSVSAALSPDGENKQKSKIAGNVGSGGLGVVDDVPIVDADDEDIAKADDDDDDEEANNTTSKATKGSNVGGAVSFPENKTEQNQGTNGSTGNRSITSPLSQHRQTSQLKKSTSMRFVSGKKLFANRRVRDSLLSVMNPISLDPTTQTSTSTMHRAGIVLVESLQGTSCCFFNSNGNDDKETGRQHNMQQDESQHLIAIFGSQLALCVTLEPPQVREHALYAIQSTSSPTTSSNLVGLCKEFPELRFQHLFTLVLSMYEGMRLRSRYFDPSVWRCDVNEIKDLDLIFTLTRRIMLSGSWKRHVSFRRATTKLVSLVKIAGAASGMLQPRPPSTANPNNNSSSPLNNNNTNNTLGRPANISTTASSTTTTTNSNNSAQSSPSSALEQPRISSESAVHFSVDVLRQIRSVLSLLFLSRGFPNGQRPAPSSENAPYRTVLSSSGWREESHNMNNNSSFENGGNQQQHQHEQHQFYEINDGQVSIGEMQASCDQALGINQSYISRYLRFYLSDLRLSDIQGPDITEAMKSNEILQQLSVSYVPSAARLHLLNNQQNQQQVLQNHPLSSLTKTILSCPKLELNSPLCQFALGECDPFRNGMNKEVNQSDHRSESVFVTSVALLGGSTQPQSSALPPKLIVNTNNNNHNNNALLKHGTSIFQTPSDFVNFIEKKQRQNQTTTSPPSSSTSFLSTASLLTPSILDLRSINLAHLLHPAIFIEIWYETMASYFCSNNVKSSTMMMRRPRLSLRLLTDQQMQQQMNYHQQHDGGGNTGTGRKRIELSGATLEHFRFNELTSRDPRTCFLEIEDQSEGALVCGLQEVGFSSRFYLQIPHRCNFSETRQIVGASTTSLWATTSPYYLRDEDETMRAKNHKNNRDDEEEEYSETEEEAMLGRNKTNESNNSMANQESLSMSPSASSSPLSPVASAQIHHAVPLKQLDPSRLSIPIFVESSSSNYEYLCSVGVAGLGTRKERQSTSTSVSSSRKNNNVNSGSFKNVESKSNDKSNQAQEQQWNRVVSDHTSLWRLIVKK